MITIEGLGGKGAVWCAVRFTRGMLTNVTHIDAYSPDDNLVLSAPPCSIYLPPVGGNTVWHSTSTSPYGPRLGKLEIGTLLGVTSTPDQPNPCEHSTVNGGLIATGPGHISPSWLRPRVEALGGQTLYCQDGSIAQFVQGQNSSFLPDWSRWSRDRKGNLVSTSSLEATNTYAMFTDFVDMVGSSNLRYAHGAVSNEWYRNTVSGSVKTDSAMKLFKINCVHVSANVWVESKWYEYHHNNSYITLKPVSQDTGLGYIVAESQRVRTITMTAIQSYNATSFKARYNCEETVSYYGMKAGLAHDTVSGTVSSSYTFDSPVLTLEPGLVTGSLFIKDKLDAFCIPAQSRAKLLYKCKTATAVRSNAVADVSGLESNWIENLAQAKGTTKAILPLIEAYKAVKTGNIMMGKRALIDAYLTYMYVIAPGKRDFNDVSKHLGGISKNISTKRFSNERRRGQLKEVVPVLSVLAELAYYCTLNLKLKDNPVAMIGNALEKLGLNPSAANIWDLIPFSFVVDWFTNIGSILSRLDAYNNNALLRDVQSRIETFKVQWPLTESEILELIGPDYSVATLLKYSWYDRRILTGLGSFDPFSGQSFDGLSVSQMTQGGALLSSYKR